MLDRRKQRDANVAMRNEIEALTTAMETARARLPERPGTDCSAGDCAAAVALDAALAAHRARARSGGG